MRTYHEWYYSGYMEKFQLLDGDLERKFVKKVLSGNLNVRNAHSHGTRPENICGIEVDEKGITSMKKSREKSTKLLEERRKLIYKGALPKTKQCSIGNGNIQCGKMNKDNRKYIAIKVVTAIWESSSNDDNIKTEKVNN